MEVNGGAELLTRLFAERLVARPEIHEVAVLTSCAIDYRSWKNEYCAGVDRLNGVRIERFSVPQERIGWMQSLASGLIMKRPHPRLLEDPWVYSQGPVVPGLVRRLRTAPEAYDAYLFVTYLYYTTVRGFSEVADRAALIPTAHDEPPIHLQTYQELFDRARAFGFLTPEERQFVDRKFVIADRFDETLGFGIDLSVQPPDGAIEGPPFLLYMGRIDRNKGVEDLCEAFAAFKARHASAVISTERGDHRGSDLVLRLAGADGGARIPERSDIIFEGFVSDERKLQLMSQCAAFVLPSYFESLSIAILEAWAFRRPVAVQGACAVTAGHIERSGGGFSYRGPDDFCSQLVTLLATRSQQERVGEAGRNYVEHDYTWPRVEERLLRLITPGAGGGAAG